jgi:hypothetical protein
MGGKFETGLLGQRWVIRRGSALREDFLLTAIVSGRCYQTIAQRKESFTLV